MVKRALIHNLGDVDLRLLRIFRIVAQCGGLSASEFELNIGRSTISKHLSDLETRLGMTLCHRGRAGFSLTLEGEKLLVEVDALLSSISSFQNRVDDIHQNLSGTLRIAVFDHSSTNPEAKFYRAIAAFDTIAPKVFIEMSVEPPNVIEAAVIEGKMDVGVVPMHSKSSMLDYVELYTEQILLYCGRGHPLFEDQTTPALIEYLTSYKYAGFGFNSPNMVVGQQMDFRRSARVQDEEALAVLILSGAYLGFLPQHVAQPLIDADCLRAVMPSKTRYQSTMAAIMRTRPEPGRREQEFMRCLKHAHGIE